jgi:D-alanyl-D-alanine carboxypeptidase
MDSSFWYNLLQNILLLSLPAIAGAFVAVAVAYIKKLAAQIEAEKPDVFVVLQLFAEAAVQAAEQMNIAGLIEDKKAYALEQVQKWLDEKGIILDASLIEQAIESEVFKLG